MKEKITPFLSKTLTHCKSYIELCIWLLVFAIGIRFFEAILLHRINHDFASSMVWNLTGLCYDISLYLRLSVCILPIFIATCFLSEKITRVVARILQSLTLLLSLICILFFTTSGFLLDKVVFTYSFKEIIGIIQSSSESPVWVYFVATILPALYYYLSGKRIKINPITLPVFAVLLLSSFFVFRELPFYAKQYLEKTNKAYFFLNSSFSIFLKNDEEKNDENYSDLVKEFHSYFPEHHFLDEQYPFLYKSEINDVLSPFFNLKSEPPNLVFIIVEGLGYEFFKNDYGLMPFLDSLSKKSLTWENCFSVSARTFGVLPGIFGAAPLGEEGFMYQCPNNPEHHSLLKILNQNNYTNQFFYGGSIDFENMQHFCNQNNMTYFKENDWDKDILDGSMKISWGYEDHLVYSQALRKLKQVSITPRVDVYLSLFTHNPYKYPNNSYYQDIIKNNVAKNKTLSNQEKNEILNSIHIYGSYLYSDWSIQQLIEGYKKRDDFENTIFIITGDHHVTAKQFGGYYNYHVPLIIYSPMLKENKTMKGVVSHRDITPTFLSLLQNNYNIETPKEVTWLNTGLDTSQTFNAHTFSPLQLIKHSIGGVLYRNYLLCEGILEEFSDGNFRKIDNPSILQQMERLLFLYRYFDLYVFNNDALIKNDNAFKYKQGSEIFNIEDTIAQGSYFAELNKLQVVEGQEGHKTTLYFDSSDLYPVGFLRFEVPDDIEEFRVEVEFNIYIKNEGTECCFVIMDLSEISYRSDAIDTDRQNKWYTYKHTITYKKELWEHFGKKPLLKIYLWNPNGLVGYVDDIKVKVRGF